MSWSLESFPIGGEGRGGEGRGGKGREGEGGSGDVDGVHPRAPCRPRLSITG